MNDVVAWLESADGDLWRQESVAPIRDARLGREIFIVIKDDVTMTAGNGHFWYQHNGGYYPHPVVWCSLSCVCNRCLDADFRGIDGASSVRPMFVNNRAKPD